jgi:FlaA1/EpsC-like NDP-sugar epimerase
VTPLSELSGQRMLITGGDGSLGRALVKRLPRSELGVWTSDIDTMDVRNLGSVAHFVDSIRPDVIFHLAGAKHAPEGELDPFGVARTNIEGTDNVLMAARSVGAKVVLASSCKACNPETAYGATKLIAERMVLNAGGTVARFYNVVETCGNVFETWRGLSDDEPLPVTPCARYFISIEQAIDLLLWCAVLPTGRYCVDPGAPVRMETMAARLYPHRSQKKIPPRRGDRLREPRYAVGEIAVPLDFAAVESVWSPHDPVRQPMREEVAA